MGNFFTGSPSGSSSGGAGRALQKQVSTGVSDVISGDPTKKQQGLAAFSMDPTALQGIGTALGQYSDPNYLDVGSNPYMKNLLSSLTDQSNTNLGKNLAGLRSQFASQGQTGAEGSSPLAQAESQAVGQTQTSLNDQIAQQLFGQYQNNQQLQLQGLGQEQNYQMLPAQLTSMMEPTLSRSKNKGAQASDFSSMMSAMNVGGGGAGGLSSMGGGGGSGGGGY
jgi:hypothetical protein